MKIEKLEKENSDIQDANKELELKLYWQDKTLKEMKRNHLNDQDQIKSLENLVNEKQSFLSNNAPIKQNEEVKSQATTYSKVTERSKWNSDLPKTLVSKISPIKLAGLSLSPI